MKTQKAVRYALVLAGLLSLTSCKEEKQASVPQKKDVKVEQLKPIKKVALDETYDEILKYYSGSSYYLSKGVYKGKNCFKIGPGVPMTAEEFKNLPFDKTLEDDLNVLQGKSSRLRTPLIRQHAKKTLQKLENTTYRPLCIKYKIDYDKLPAKVRASIFCIDMATGGKIASYHNFLTAISEKDWKRAAEQSYVSAKAYFKANPNAAASSETNSSSSE